MHRDELWFTATPGGERPVLILTRDPIADRIDAVVVAALSCTRRGLVSELELTATEDRVPSDCVVNFDSIHTLPRTAFAYPASPRHVCIRLADTPDKHRLLTPLPDTAQC